jgi:hypothetical protein
MNPELSGSVHRAECVNKIEQKLMNRQRNPFLVIENTASCSAYRNIKRRLSRSLGNEKHMDQ